MMADLNFDPLENLFREELFKVLLKKERITEERILLLRSWKHSGFRVHSERRVAQGERQELESLLQYFERPPVSLQRLEVQESRAGAASLDTFILYSARRSGRAPCPGPRTLG